MASIFRRLILQSSPRTPRLPLSQITLRAPIVASSRHRQFHTTPFRRKQDDEKDVKLSQTETHNGETLENSYDARDTTLRKAIMQRDTPEILRLMKRDSITPEEVEELRADIEEITILEAKEAAYERLTDRLIEAPDDPEIVEQIFRESGFSQEELQSGPLLPSGEEATEEDIMAVEKAIWDEISPGNAPVIVDEFQKFLDDANGNESLAMRAFAKHIRAKAGDPAVEDTAQALSVQKEEPFYTAPQRRDPKGFWNSDGREPDMGADEEFDQDEMPTKGHQWLDLQRDIREWQRYTIWELPLLSRGYQYK
jgi:hypothetical protein